MSLMHVRPSACSQACKIRRGDVGPGEHVDAAQVLMLGRKVRKIMRDEAAANNLPAPKAPRTFKHETLNMSAEEKAAHKRQKFAANAVNMRLGLRDQAARRMRYSSTLVELLTCISCVAADGTAAISSGIVASQGRVHTWE